MIRDHFWKDLASTVREVCEAQTHRMHLVIIADESIRPNHLSSGQYVLAFNRFQNQTYVFVRIWRLKTIDKCSSEAEIEGYSTCKTIQTYQSHRPGDLSSVVSAFFEGHDGTPFIFERLVYNAPASFES